jgi:hypothetical protein
MQPNDLKDALKKAGVPIYKNDKISKKDLTYLTSKSTGIEVDQIEYLGIDKGIDKYTYKFRLTLNGGDKEKIENIFAMNKDICQSIQIFLKKKLGCIQEVNCYLKSVNEKYAWVNIEVMFSIAEEITSELFDPFWYRWFEKIGT